MSKDSLYLSAASGKRSNQQQGTSISTPLERHAAMGLKKDIAEETPNLTDISSRPSIEEKRIIKKAQILKSKTR